MLNLSSIRLKYREKIPLAAIKVPTNRLRTVLDKKLLDDLAISIAEHGLIHPIGVRRKDAEILLVHGYRRLLAVKMLKHQTIAALDYSKMTDEESRLIEREENLHHVNLTAAELAQRREEPEEKEGAISMRDASK